MLFNSYGFLFLFAPVFYFVYWRCKTVDQKKVASLVASYVFYGWWSPKFALLMLGTTSVDYFTAKWIEDSPTPHKRNVWLAVSMSVNLGVLGIFKYFDFFVGSVNHVAGAPLLPLLNVILPIGISFYTFESMSYTIDVYRRKTHAVRRFLDYGHFVTMFPRLVAGPIVRYTDLAAQLRELPRSLGAAAVMRAAHFFVLGLAKKVLFADILATKLVDPLFARSATLSLAEGWTAAVGYTVQLYLDFSGYSDMAVGLAMLMGLRLPRNFEMPYKAENPSDFWRRWHTSLSTWLRDYLYIPLGGNRASKLGVSKNLFLTMLLGGLWHGANWTFVIWGAYHGAALVLYNVALSKLSFSPPKLVQRALTFVFVVFGWVIFRADTIGKAREVMVAMLGAHGLGAAFIRASLPMLAWLGIALAISLTRDTYDLSPPGKRWTAALLAVLFAICITRLSAPSPFLYFQF